MAGAQAKAHNAEVKPAPVDLDRGRGRGGGGTNVTVLMPDGFVDGHSSQTDSFFVNFKVSFPIKVLVHNILVPKVSFIVFYRL